MLSLQHCCVVFISNLQVFYFQSLTVSLLHHQPHTPVQFLIDALEQEPEVGWGNVSWDTFLHLPPQSHQVNDDRMQRKLGNVNSHTAENENLKGS